MQTETTNIGLSKEHTLHENNNNKIAKILNLLLIIFAVTLPLYVLFNLNDYFILYHPDYSNYMPMIIGFFASLAITWIFYKLSYFVACSSYGVSPRKKPIETTISKSKKVQIHIAGFESSLVILTLLLITRRITCVYYSAVYDDIKDVLFGAIMAAFFLMQLAFVINSEKACSALTGTESVFRGAIDEFKAFKEEFKSKKESKIESKNDKTEEPALEYDREYDDDDDDDDDEMAGGDIFLSFMLIYIDCLAIIGFAFICWMSLRKMY